MTEPGTIRRAPALWGLALFLLVVSLLGVWAIVRYWHFRQQVRATVAELRETLTELRSRNLGFDDEVLDGFEQHIDLLEGSHLPKLGRPVPLFACIAPAADDARRDGPVLTLYWLEAGQVTDGVVLEVASERGEVQEGGEREPEEIARVTGWANALSDAEMRSRYGGRFDRQASVDVQLAGGERAADARPIIRLTPQRLRFPLSARLLYDDSATDSMPVHVAPELFKVPARDQEPAS